MTRTMARRAKADPTTPKRCSTCRKSFPLSQLVILRCDERGCSYEAASCGLCQMGVVGNSRHASREKLKAHRHRMHNALWDPDGTSKIVGTRRGMSRPSAEGRRS